MIRIIITILALIAPQFAFALSSSSIPTKIPVYWAQTASGSFSTCPVPTPSQIPITAGRASWTDGFPPLTFLPAVSGGIPPFGQDFNGVLCQISQWTRWFNAGASVPYDATFQSTIGGYPKGAIVPSATTFGIFWISTVENNASNPDTGGAGWTLFTSLPQNLPVTGASTTLTAGQCGSVIERSNTGTPMSDVLPGTSPGVLPQGCFVTIVNNDASAMLSVKAGTGAAIKTLNSNGWAYVGPGQSITYESDGANYWATHQATRTKLGANTTLFVAVTGGSNNNNGLGGGTAFADMNFAYAFAAQNLDLNGFVLTISVADGSYGQSSFAGPLLGAISPNSVLLTGNTGTPANVTVGSSSTFGTMYASEGAMMTISGFTLTNTGAGSTLLTANGGTHVQIQTMNFGSAGGLNHISATRSSLIDIIGSYSITGDSGCHWIATSGGEIETVGGSITITAVGTRGVSSGFACVQYPSQIVINSSPVPSFVGTFTGPRYNGSLNGIISTGGQGVNYFPGNSAGSVSTGAQYN